MSGRSRDGGHGRLGQRCQVIVEPCSEGVVDEAAGGVERSCALATGSLTPITRAPAMPSTRRRSFCAQSAPYEPVAAPAIASSCPRGRRSPMRPRGPVDRVLQQPRDRPVVLRTSRPATRRPRRFAAAARCIAGGRILAVHVGVVVRQLAEPLVELDARRRTGAYSAAARSERDVVGASLRLPGMARTRIGQTRLDRTKKLAPQVDAVGKQEAAAWEWGVPADPELVPVDRPRRGRCPMRSLPHGSVAGP